MEFDTFLKTELENAIHVFSSEHLYKHILIPNFDCSTLPDKNVDGRDLPESLKFDFFSHLHHFDHSDGNINDFPCLYVFEIVKCLDVNQILEHFKSISKQNSDRVLPALKRKMSLSNYLYVGKAQKNVGGRLVTHLGYNQRSNNHGLQLVLWVKEFNPSIQINVHVFRFKKEFLPFLSAFEIILAKKLNPIIGKH